MILKRNSSSNFFKANGNFLLPPASFYIYIYDEKRERRNSWSKFSRDRLIGIFKFILG